MDFFSDTSVYYIGSHNSFYLADGGSADDAHQVWILESGLANFITHESDSKILKDGQTLGT